MRHFCSYGPVNCKAHFCVPRQTLITTGVTQLIGSPDEEGGHYFTIWAPRQCGKTWLMRQIKQEIALQYPEKFALVNFSLGGLRGLEVSTDQKTGMIEFPLALSELLEATLPGKPSVSSWHGFYQLFSTKRGLWDRPVILLLDEVDALPSVLSDIMVAQFRELYLDRKNNWLHGLALVGIQAVLGIANQQGAPFNIQRSLRVPNFTLEEVKELYRQYIEESGQTIEATVVDKVYQSTRGQPGLVSWFGELLTDKYNPGVEQRLDEEIWKQVWLSAIIEPNNTLLNIIVKAKEPLSQDFLTVLFIKSNIPFFFHQALHNYLYFHGIIEPVLETSSSGNTQNVCRFTSPFIQRCLYDALSQTFIGSERPILALEPLDELTDVFGGTAIDLPALLTRYKDYLARLKAQNINPWHNQPRRKTDLNLTEAVGHFHLFGWLKEAVEDSCTVSPEFPTGNGKVDIHLQCGEQQGIIEVKSFIKYAQIKEDKKQAIDYAKKLGINCVTIALFIPVIEEAVLNKLSTQEIINGIKVDVVAIGWV